MRGAAGLGLIGVLLVACTQEAILPGERFGVREPLDASIPVEGKPLPVAAPGEPENQSRAIALPGMSANADWSQRGGNAQHDGPHGSLSAAPQLVWAAPIGAGNSRRNRITATPVVSGGVVFAMDALARVTAVSTSGATLWQADLAAEFDRGGSQSGGGLAAGSGRVYATTGYGEVVALDAASGQVVWRQRMGSPAAGAPAVAGAQVFAMSADGTGWALDAGAGRVLWTLPAAENVLATETGAAPAVSGGTVIFPFAAGVMVAASTDAGTPLWQAAITGSRLGRAYANSGDITGDPVVTGGAVYVGTAGWSDGRVPRRHRRADLDCRRGRDEPAAGGGRFGLCGQRCGTAGPAGCRYGRADLGGRSAQFHRRQGAQAIAGLWPLRPRSGRGAGCHRFVRRGVAALRSGKRGRDGIGCHSGWCCLGAGAGAGPVVRRFGPGATSGFPLAAHPCKGNASFRKR